MELHLGDMEPLLGDMVPHLGDMELHLGDMAKFEIAVQISNSYDIYLKLLLPDNPQNVVAERGA